VLQALVEDLSKLGDWKPEALNATVHGLAERLGLKLGDVAQPIRVAVAGMAAAMTILAAIMLSGFDSLPVMIAGLFIGYGFLGLVLPTCGVLSLEHHGAIAGTASALGGALGMMTGAVVMALSGLFADAGAQPMVAMIALCAILACAITFVTLRATQRAAAVETA
jgi:DHA1 family bicyclomycin/chloramphenicol resistance-like MFS transporter